MPNGEEREDSAQVEGEGELSTPLVPPLRFTQDDGTPYPDWETTTLGEVASMRSGGTPTSSKKEYYGDDYFWVSIKDMTTQGRFVNYSEKKISEEGFRNSSTHLFDTGTILYAMYASVGEVSVLGTPATTSQAILGIVPETNILDKTYLYHFLLSYKKQALAQKQTGTQPNLSKTIVEKFPIPLPTLPEQEKIANLLSLVDGKIENLDQQRELWREYKRGLGARLFTQEYRFTQDDGTPYPDWETVQLGEVAKLYQSETLAKQDLEGGENPVYGANGIIGWTNKSNHRTSQVVVACRGVCGMVNYTKPISWINGNSMVLNIDENETINKQYFYYAVSQISFEKIVSGSAQPQITRKPLSKITLSVPSLGEQGKIANLLSLVDGKIESLDQQHKLWREYKQALLQQLFP